MKVHAYVYLQLKTEVHFLSQQQNVTGQAVEVLESRSVRRCWVWCVPQLHQSAFSSIATRRNLTDWDITELILESDSDAHSSENKDISAQNDSDTVDTTDKLHTVDCSQSLKVFPIRFLGHKFSPVSKLCQIKLCA